MTFPMGDCFVVTFKLGMTYAWHIMLMLISMTMSLTLTLKVFVRLAPLVLYFTPMTLGTYVVSREL